MLVESVFTGDRVDGGDDEEDEDSEVDVPPDSLLDEDGASIHVSLQITEVTYKVLMLV